LEEQTTYAVYKYKKKKMVMSPVEPGKTNDCAGECQQQFTLPDPIFILSTPDDGHRDISEKSNTNTT
jgi:hypothetical protein